MPRKRTHDEMTASETPLPSKENSLLQNIRNMWEFACVMQFIFLFGKTVKIDEDFDIEDFENECLMPGYSEKLEEIGLALLKYVSSHRGLNYDIWDEYTRRQYQAKAPHLNPYGEEEEPKRFRNFDIYTKIRILHHLTTWTFWNPDRMRQAYPELQKENDQARQFRIEPVGWDDDEREYYVLDDNRLYRRTEPPVPSLPKAKLKYTSKKAQALRRRSRAADRAAAKRRKTDYDADEDSEMHDEGSEAGSSAIDTRNNTPDGRPEVEADPASVNTFGGFTWECIAITLQEYNKFCDSIKKTKDANQQNLYDFLTAEVLPDIEKMAESQRRKIERRQRELAALEKMATAKRSSRIADKQEREKREQETVVMEKKRVADLAAAHRDEEKQKLMEQERQSRMMTREQRIRDREYKRVLMEEQLAKDSEEERKIEEGAARGSSRQIKERIAKSKKELEALSDGEWTFDCSGCGKHGRNFDDGQHSVACERCNVWQHSKCLGVSKSAAESDDFHFVCADCKRREEEASRPKISLKFRVGSSASPPQQRTSMAAPPSPVKRAFAGVEVPPVHGPHLDGLASGVLLHPAPTSPRQQLNGAHQPSVAVNQAQNDSTQASNGVASQTPTAQHFRSGSGPQTTPWRASPSQQLNGQHIGRLPSPIINRPTMSPTQGNPDVGPIAGVPGSSPAPGQSQTDPFASRVGANGHTVSSNQDSHGIVSGNVTPQQRSFTSQSPPASQSAHNQIQPFSGLSPIKRSVSPPERKAATTSTLNIIPIKSNASPLGSQNSNAGRNFSGTSIVPPIEDFAPSPEQLRTQPVPTPSKQSQPLGSPTLNSSSQSRPSDNPQPQLLNGSQSQPADEISAAQAQPQLQAQGQERPRQ